MSLSFTVDAFGRTYRSTAVTVGKGASIMTKRGLAIIPDLPDLPRDGGRLDRVEVLPDNIPPAQALDAALDRIPRLYGSNTAKFVALQVEYPWIGPGPLTDSHP